MKNVIEILKERGLLEATTSEELAKICQKPLAVYIGFDPTADSLHIGNLVGMMVLAWFQRSGHTPIAIVGGATGMIGDPSGRSSERNLLDAPTLEANLKGIQKSLGTLLNLENCKILNNFDWFSHFSFIEFLRDVGKHFRVGQMLAKESVKTRLSSDEGLSYTEFSYQLLQGYDFLHLYEKHQVLLQIGGSDQWGNITAGTDLIRKVLGATTYGLTFPLLTRSDGKKFGKSESGTIWLNAERLSPYDFFQYFMRVPDADLIKLFKCLTFIDLEEIQVFEEELKQPHYVPHALQRRLATEITRMIHGEAGLEMALKLTTAAAPGKVTLLDRATLEMLAQEMPTSLYSADEILGRSVIEVLLHLGLGSSKSELRKLIQNGGVYLNNARLSDELLKITPELLLEGEFLLFSIGKKKKTVVRIQSK